MKKFKRLICLILVSVIMCSSLLLSVEAAFYTKIVSDNSEITSILNIIKNNDGKTVYDKIYYLFYTSDFAAAYNKKFPYPNSGNSVNKVVDKNVTYTFPNTAKGCYLYADYVSRYVYNIVSWDSACKSVYITKTGGSMTAAQVKSTIQTYAQAGEHIRIDSKHSIAFLAYTDAGFYYMDYMDDSNPKIFIRYTTWQQFANQCNSYGKWACIYDVDRSTNDNSTSTTVTIKNDTSKDKITDTNAILWAMVNKPSSYGVTKIGIRIRKDGGTYENGWEKFENPSKNYQGETYMQPYYNLNTELNLTLTHATKYYYKIYAKVEGKEYWSPENSFTTTGSHSYGSWTTTAAATCTATGKQTRKCSCGKTETKTLPALGHNFSQSFTVDKKATCAEAGSKSKHCTRCNAKSEITAISVLTTHNLDYFVTTKQPTCTNTGTIKTTCTICKNSWLGTEPALGHDFSSEWVIDKQATCNSQGSKSHHCKRCDAKSEITTINSLSHQWDDWKTIKEPTTTSVGQKQRACKREGCSDKETMIIAKLAQDGHTHKYNDWVILKPATCTDNGTQEHTCTVCGEKENQSISKTEHTFGEWIVAIAATEDENGLEKRVCSECEAEETREISELIENTDGQTREEILEQNNSKNNELDNDASTDLKVDKTNDNNPDKSSSNKNTYLLLFISSAAMLVILGTVLTIVFMKRKNN